MGRVRAFLGALPVGLVPVSAMADDAVQAVEVPHTFLALLVKWSPWSYVLIGLSIAFWAVVIWAAAGRGKRGD